MSKVAAIGRVGLVIALIVIIVIAAVGVSTYMSSTQKTSTSRLTTTGSTISENTTSSSLSTAGSSTTVTSTLCTFPGQSMGLYFSVLSDSASAPVVGANVTAFYEFNGSCNGGFEPKQTTETFTTNGNESYFLDGLNDGNFSIGIYYSGQNYTLTSQLRPSVYTCVVVYLPSGTINVLFPPHNCPNQTQQNSTTSLTCSISGQPGGLQLRVVSDSTLQPIVGAKVTATSHPAYCSSFGGAPFPATTSSTMEFTTNGTLWYSFPTDNDGSYSFAVGYSNRDYAFNASIAPVSLSCATLYLPSGRTNITMTFVGVTCPVESSVSVPTFQGEALANVTIPGYPGEIAVNPDTNRIYVSDLFANKLTVLNASIYKIIDTITLPDTCNGGIAIDQQNDIVYDPVLGCTNEINVPNSCNSANAANTQGSILEINGTTDTILGELPVGANQLVFNPSNGDLYGITASSLLVIDPHSSTPMLANISLTEEPVGLALNSRTSMIYVDTCQMSLACLYPEFLIINGTTNVIQSNVSLGVFDAINFPLVVDSNTGTVYVMGLSGQNMTLLAINGTSGEVEYSYNIGSSCAGAGGGSLVLDEKSKVLYAAFASQSYFLGINVTSGAVRNMLVGGAGDQGVAFNPVSNQLYITPEPEGTNGTLLVLPNLASSQTAVNLDLLQSGICLP